MKILFLSDENGREHRDPSALLVEVQRELTRDDLKDNEVSDRFCGGNPLRTLDKLNVQYKCIDKWKKESDYTEQDYDMKYVLYSGNY